jgi:hypothetical protein
MQQVLHDKDNQCSLLFVRVIGMEQGFPNENEALQTIDKETM